MSHTPSGFKHNQHLLKANYLSLLRSVFNSEKIQWVERLPWVSLCVYKFYAAQLVWKIELSHL